jgi:hypothetical protein
MEENEGYVILFIEQYLDIPAPRLYAMYRVGTWLYLIMERLKGRNLEGLWPSLSGDGKSSICSQLRQICDKMRALPSPGFYGSITNGALSHWFFFSLDGDKSISGPF